MRQLLLLSLLLPFALPCPQAVSSLCRCEDLHNGVSLNCSDSDGAVVLETLKANQAKLGLIQNLVMHRTNMRAVPASFFAGLFIKRLDLSYNRIVKLDPAAFAGMSPVLQELVLTHNNLTEIPSAALNEAKTLLKLDLSNNTIGDLTADQAIPTLPKLYDLNLAYNKICAIHKSALAGVRDTVQTINFGHNCLSSVPAPAIRGFKQLQALHMHNNEIGSLEALAFMNLPVMNLLNLAANKITEIQPQAFLNVPVLRYLYLTNNKIASIVAHQFSGFEQLEMLDLTRNQLTTVPKQGFSGLTSLRQLYLGENQISTLETDAFANSTVVILILASNNLTSLDEGPLNGLPNLQQISLKDNHISSIHQNAFYNAPSAAMVDLSGNDLSELPPSLFLTQLNLLLIDLSRNKILKTPYSSFNRRVGTVLLQENPLCCTEKVHMLQDGVGVYIPNSEDLICGGRPTTTTIAPEESPANPEEPSEPETPVEAEEQPAFAAAPAQEELPILRTSDASAERRSDPIYSRLGIQGIAPKKIKFEGAPEPAFQVDAEPSLPIIRNEETVARPSILNVRPSNIVSRPRNHFGPELTGGRLPSRENPFARTAVHVPSSRVSTTRPTIEVEEEEEDEEEEGPIEPEMESPQQPPIPVEVEKQIEDEALNKMIDIISAPPTTTGEPRPRSTTDIHDNPNIIHPFPVPFLKRGPHLSSSSIIRPSTPSTGPTPPVSPLPSIPRVPALPAPRDDFGLPSRQTVEDHPEVAAGFIPALEEPTQPQYTLPPSIVLAPARSVPSIAKNAVTDERYSEFAMRTQEQDELFAPSSSSSSRSTPFLSPAIIVGICISVVVVTMIVVFVGLCIAKHKNMRRSCRLGSSAESDSTTARTNAYVAAQQAQMNAMYGTMSRSRSMSISRPEDSHQPWTYNPSNTPSNYCTYYK